MLCVPLRQSLIGVLVASTFACASAHTGRASAQPNAGADGQLRLDLEHKLGVSQDRAALAREVAQATEASSATSLAFAAEDVAHAEAQLVTFKEYDVPTRTDRARMGLRGSRDSAQEAAEELAQIESMYKDQDLDDVTAEFVVSRGRRRAERAAARIEIEERELKKLTERLLPAEEGKLVQAVNKARAARQKLEREGAIARRKQDIALKEAERAVVEAQQAMEKLSGEDGR